MRKKPTLKDKLVSEAIDFFKIDSLLDDDSDDDFSDLEGNFDFDDYDFGFDDAEEEIDEDEEDYSERPHNNWDDDEFNLDDPEAEDDDDEDDGDGDEESDNGSKSKNEGLIRTVKGAYMVFKRLTPSNNYEELWIYNTNNVKYQTKIRNSILAGTDVDPISLISPDGEQKATMYSKGNVQFLHIDGLPN